MQQTINPQVWRQRQPRQLGPKYYMNRRTQAGMSLRFIEDNAKTQAIYTAAVALLHASEPIGQDMLTFSAEAFAQRLNKRRQLDKSIRIRAAGRIYKTANRARIKGNM